MKITWDTPAFLHSDGTPRSRPLPSTVHGWLAKWRGTFKGDEQLRSKGMREMREAEFRRKQEKARKSNSNSNRARGSSWSFFGSTRKKAPSTNSTRRPTLGQRTSSHRLVGTTSRQITRSSTKASKSSHSSRHPSRRSSRR
ncbi:hypothetical protein C8J56DRAFT_934141 [Mycena floridula]|nr:hypothetical protein C8J56DRAFT_934141 [Mycena floridula]